MSLQFFFDSGGEAKHCESIAEVWPVVTAT